MTKDFRRAITFVHAVIVGGWILTLAMLGGVVYVAWHFIRKAW